MFRHFIGRHQASYKRNNLSSWIESVIIIIIIIIIIIKKVKLSL
jgi:hypothetical protein